MPENAGVSPSSKRRFWIAGGVILSIIAATVLIAVVSFRHDVSPNECIKLEQLKNVSIAHLENGRYKEKRGAGQGDLAKADAGFLELAEKLPADPLGPRNLAITRLLELQDKQIAPEGALEAADLLLKLENDSASAHLLAGQLAEAAHDKPRAAAEFAKASELAPTDADIWFRISRFWIESPDEADQTRGREALARAYQAAPDNLFLQQAWLSAQAEAHDPEMVQTLSQVRQLLAARPGLVDDLRKHARIADPLAFVDEALTAAEQGRPAVAEGRARQLANVIRAETWSLNDLRRVDRDPLEYILSDFQVPCDDKTLEVEAPIEVKLVELAAPKQLPPLLGLQDISLADFDLDGRLDVIVLREALVEVYGRAGDGDELSAPSAGRSRSGRSRAAWNGGLRAAPSRH
jgi:tetratricopeptide (TPR) repeat protein